jgi:hypothetical protein
MARTDKGRLLRGTLWTLATMGLLAVWWEAYSARCVADSVSDDAVRSRALAPGRSQWEVEQWLGYAPEQHHWGTGPRAYTVLWYKSGGPDTPQGDADIVVLLDHGGRVVTVYYPDQEYDRVIVDRLGFREGRMLDDPRPATPPLPPG